MYLRARISWIMYTHCYAQYLRESGEQRKPEAYPPIVVPMKSQLAYKPEGMRAQPHFNKTYE